jgi:CubicO group peptidase (beta-lactamase class C family)
MIIEKISGLQFHDFIVKEIAEPLGMPSLGVWPYNSTNPEATVNYEILNDSIQIGTLEDLPYFSGDGALSASVVDMVKLPGILQTEKLFPKKLLNKMLTQTILGSFKIDYGTGMRLGDLSGYPVWGHSGGANGSTLAKLDYFPEEKLSISIIINTLFGPKNTLDLEEAILPLLLGLEKPKTKTNLINPQQYEGSFVMRDRWGGDNKTIRVIKEKDGKLFRDNPITDTPGQELFYLGEDMFRNDFYPLDRFKFHFVKGKVVASSEYANGMFIQVWLAE